MVIRLVAFLIALLFATFGRAQDFVFEDDFETINCANDRDGDRLNDCIETNTGVFVSGKTPARSVGFQIPTATASKTVMRCLAQPGASTCRRWA